MYTYIKELITNNVYDVIVIGGGPSGVAAAAAAGREGSKTLLIESTSTLGGMGTIGLVSIWCHFSDKEKIIYRSLAEKVLRESKKNVINVSEDRIDGVPIDSEALKRVYDNLLKEYNVDILFNTTLCDCIKENDEIKGIIINNKQGLQVYNAKIFIDTTGDADLVAMAGLETNKDEKLIQPSTLCFVISNVNISEYYKFGNLHGSNPNSIIHKIIADKKYPLIDGHVCAGLVGPNTLSFNAGHVPNVDVTNPIEYSKGMIKGRETARQYHEALKEYLPEAFKDSFLVETAPSLGIRESRRIIGDYILNLDDYAERRIFNDEIGRSSYPIDVHGNANAAKPSGKYAHYGVGESFGIPYRTLTPKGLKNVLVAGKAISADRMAQGSIRVMGVCLVTGEAAGTASSFALNNNNDVHSIDTNKLRDKLRSYGAYFK